MGETPPARRDRLTMHIWEYFKRTFRRDPRKFKKRTLEKNWLVQRQAALDNIRKGKMKWNDVVKRNPAMKHQKAVTTRKQAEEELLEMKRYGLHSEQRSQKKGMWSRKAGAFSRMKKMEDYKFIGFEGAKEKKLKTDKIVMKPFTIKGRKVVGVWQKGKRGMQSLKSLE